MLEQLHQHNLFIIPLDDERHWYRYHHLFAEVLRARLQKASDSSTGSVAELHHRASTWYEQQGWLAEAVEHALAAGVFEQAARLIEQMGMMVFAQGAIHYVLNKWLASLPVELVRVRPRLGLIQAWLLFNQMDPEAALRWLGEAEQALPQDDMPGDDPVEVRNLRGEIAATRAIVTILSRQFEPERVNHWAEEALDCLRPDNASYRGLVFGTLGHAAMQLGDVARAEQALAEATTISRAASHEYMALATTVHLTNMQRVRGKLSLAIATCRQAFDWAGEHEAQTTFGAGSILVHLADLLRERNDLAAALDYATSGFALSHQGVHPSLFMMGALVLVRINQALGNLAGALESLGQIRPVAAKLYHADWLLTLLPAVEAHLHLTQGDLPGALRWVNSTNWTEITPPHFRGTHHFIYAYEYGGITRAQVLIAQAWSRSEAGLARPEQVATQQNLLLNVLAHLDRLGQVAEASGLMWLRIKVYILQALANQALGEPAQAMEKLEQALSVAEPEGYIRIFVDEGAPMAALLHQAAVRGVAPNYIGRLLAAFPAEEQGSKEAEERTVSSSPLPLRPPASLLIESLTPRELEVLHLMAAGHSNQEIARALVVSVGTVKKHLNNIFGKLNAASRTQAVARARELQLL